MLKAVDGRTVSLNGRERALKTAGSTTVTFEPDWRSELLGIITNPNVAYILMIIGIYGLMFEFYNPGLVGPGVVGAICLLLALYAFNVLPVNYAGLALILLGVALMAAEAFAPSFGVLGIGGVIAFVIGSIMLMDTDVPGFQVYWPLVGGVATGSALLFLTVVYFIDARTQPRRGFGTGGDGRRGRPGHRLGGRAGPHPHPWRSLAGARRNRRTAARKPGAGAPG